MDVIVYRQDAGVTRTQLPDNHDRRDYDLDRLGLDVAGGRVRWFLVVGAGAPLPDLPAIQAMLDEQLFSVHVAGDGVDETRLVWGEQRSIEEAEEAAGYGYTVERRPAILAEQLIALRGEWCVVQYRQQGETVSTIAMPRGPHDDGATVAERFTVRRSGIELFLNADEIVSVRKTTSHDE